MNGTFHRGLGHLQPGGNVRAGRRLIGILEVLPKCFELDSLDGAGGLLAELLFRRSHRSAGPLTFELDLAADPDAFPDTLEFEGPPGIIAARNPQFRYTYPFSKHHSAGISVEKSGTDTPFSTQFGVPIGTSKFPDLVGFYRYENNDGHIHLAALFRNVGGMVPNEQVFNLARHVGAYGLSLSGVWGLPFGKPKDSVVFQLVIGKGISNYYNDNFGLGTDVGFNAEGHLVATPTGSATFGEKKRTGPRRVKSSAVV
jgi:hypothetical protein